MDLKMTTLVLLDFSSAYPRHTPLSDKPVKHDNLLIAISHIGTRMLKVSEAVLALENGQEDVVHPPYKLIVLCFLKVFNGAA